MRLSELKARERKVDKILREKEQLVQFFYDHSYCHSDRAFMGLFFSCIIAMVLIIFIMSGGI